MVSPSAAQKLSRLPPSSDWLVPARCSPHLCVLALITIEQQRITEPNHRNHITIIHSIPKSGAE
jgi:hypothetical protein